MQRTFCPVLVGVKIRLPIRVLNIHIIRSRNLFVRVIRVKPFAVQILVKRIHTPVPLRPVRAAYNFHMLVSKDIRAF